MSLKRMMCPEDELWSVRRGAAVYINLSLSHSRYIHGEVVIETRYRLFDGAEDCDPTSRIWLGDSRREIVTQLYEKLFDAVLIAREYDVIQVVIHFPCHRLGQWERDFLVTVYIVAHELTVPVTGTDECETFSHPAEGLTLSDFLDGIPDEEDDID